MNTIELTANELAERYTTDDLDRIVAEAERAAYAAADTYFHDKLGGVDQFACGFAWVDIYGIKGNTRIGKRLSAAGIRKSYTGSFQMWNPSKYPVQNVDTLEAGARAAALVFQRYGFRAYAGSRLD